MLHHGFLRVAAASPVLRVADCAFNAERILGLMERAEAEGVAVLVFPELSLTGYTCADLFQQHDAAARRPRRAGTRRARPRPTSSPASPSSACRWPWTIRSSTAPPCCTAAGCSASCPSRSSPITRSSTRAAGSPPPPPPAAARSSSTATRSPSAPICSSPPTDVEGLIVGVEICEDLWVPVPPSSSQALAGATVLVNLSASNEVIGKAAYRRQLVVNQSGRCMAAYVYASCGVWESTTDVVFGGHCLIAENGTLLAESRRFQREDDAAGRRRRPRPPARRPHPHQQLRRRPALPRPRPRRSSASPFALARRRAAGRPAPRRSTPIRSCRRARSSCASAARRSSRPRSPAWPSGWSTSASRRWPSASPAGSIRRWPCWWPARRWTRWACRATRIRAFTMPGFGTTQPHPRQRPRPDAAPRRHRRARSTSARSAWRRCGRWATGRSASTWTGLTSRS